MFQGAIKKEMTVEQGGSQSNEVEDIINTPSIIDLLKLVKKRDDLRSLDSVQNRFRIACVENDLIEGYRQADWIDVFDKFLFGLKDINFSQRFSSIVDQRGSPPRFHGMDNRRLTYYLPMDDFDFDENPLQHIKIHFTLIEPKVKDPKLPKKVDILFRRTERLGPDEMEFWYELGNRQQVAALAEDELIYHNSEIEIDTVLFYFTVYFDEEDHVYFKRPETGIAEFKIYQKDLRTNAEPVLIHTIQDIYYVADMGLQGGKMFALITVRINPDLVRRIDCVDLATKKVISVPASREIDHNNETVPYENGILFTDGNCRSYIYLLDEDKLVLKVIPSTLRTQLNRYTFLYQRRILDTYQLKAFSFVDGKFVETHIGEIDQSTIICRHTDHVFAVLLKKRCYIYYEEKPGTKPVLLHADNRRTIMRNRGDYWVEKTPLPVFNE